MPMHKRRYVDELLTIFAGWAKLLLAHLVESGELTLEDVKKPCKALRKGPRKQKPRRDTPKAA
jgi:BlaI family penicillinase repressor